MKNSFDPEKSLLSLTVVHYIIGTCLLLAFAISIPIAYKCFSLLFLPSGEGFNYLAIQFKVPLAILALGLALIGLCGANHRSEQTKRQILRTADQIARTDQQILLTRSQNNFSNYFKHIEEFEKYCDSNLSEPKNKKTRKIHSRFFPCAREGDYKVNLELLSELISQVSDLQSSLNSIIKQGPNFQAKNFSNFLDSITILTERFGVQKPKLSGRPFNYNSIEYYLPAGTIKGLYLSAAHVVSNIDVMLAFDPQYFTPSVVEVFLGWEKSMDTEPKINLITTDLISSGMLTY